MKFPVFYGNTVIKVIICNKSVGGNSNCTAGFMVNNTTIFGRNSIERKRHIFPWQRLLNKCVLFQDRNYIILLVWSNGSLSFTEIHNQRHHCSTHNYATTNKKFLQPTGFNHTIVLLYTFKILVLTDLIRIR